MLGIIGGMGPLASSEFLKTIYECNSGPLEQESPVCFVYSDPTLPDRTEAIRSGMHEPVVERLSRAFQAMQTMGARKTVVACVTAHYFLPKIEHGLTLNNISLVDVIIDELSALQTPHLMFCSSGTRQARIFENHPRWNTVRSFVVTPSAADQELIHQLIYSQIKPNRFDEGTLSAIDALQRKYNAGGIIAGCTELHLVTKHLLHDPNHSRFIVLDPLMIVARNFRRVSVESTECSQPCRRSPAA